MNERANAFVSTLILAMVPTNLAIGSDTEFTYQGELKDNGALASGSFDMDFLLWDDSTGGSQIGTPNSIPGVQVADGKFSVELDFGAGSFDNSGRWLEIVVQGSTLSPRVPITRSPYSIQTRGIFVDGSENVGIGTTAPEGLLHVKKQTTTTNLPERMLIVDSHDDPNNFDLQLGSGSGILFKVPYQFDSQVGAAIDAVRATNVELNSATELVFSISNNSETLDEAMRIDEIGRVGIGTTTPSYRLHVEDALTAIYGESTSGTAIYGESTNGDGVRGRALAPSGVVYGVYGETPSISGRGVFGWATASSGNSAWGVYGASNSTSGRGVYGHATATSGANTGVYGHSEGTIGIGVYGYGNSPAGYDFYAGGPGANYGAASSKRWKNNIENIDRPLQKICRLRGVYFDWDEEHGGHHDVGMIAEEVGKVLPEIVTYEENGIDASGMDYGKLTPLLVEAVNALRAEKDTQIASLQTENNDLRAENDILRKRLDSLEGLVEQIVSAHKEPKK